MRIRLRRTFSQVLALKFASVSARAQHQYGRFNLASASRIGIDESSLSKKLWSRKWTASAPHRSRNVPSASVSRSGASSAVVPFHIDTTPQKPHLYRQPSAD